MQDLRKWIEDVSGEGLFKSVSGADLNLEVGAITDLNAKMGKHTLMFSDFRNEEVTGRLMTGALLDSKRVALTFGLNKNLSDMELVKVIKQRMKEFNVTDFGKYSPKYVSSSPLFENVLRSEEIDLTKFPAPKWHEKDGGNYIGTADAVITKDPDDGDVNVGTYRVMLEGRNTLGIHISHGHHGWGHIKKYLDRGEEAPIAISFGHHPLIYALGGLEIPAKVSEYNVAGLFSGQKYEVISGPVTGLPIPADSELAIEGYVTKELVNEGPFGEFFGYYAGGVSPKPVIRVEAIYHRNDPILMGTAPGKPPYDYSYFRCPMRSALLWQYLEDSSVPDIKGVWCHESAYSRGFNVISIKQNFAGHDRQAGYIAAQSRISAWAGRYTVIVDEDIDPSNIDEVIWAMASRTDPATSVEILRNVWGARSDPTTVLQSGKSSDEITSSQAIIFSTKSYYAMKHNLMPEVVSPSEELIREVLSKWEHVLH